MPRRPQRGTEPYSAKVIASMTVDLPEPVGPTRAKKLASVKSTRVGARKAANPFMSSTTGRMAVPLSAGRIGAGDFFVELGEQRRDLGVHHGDGGAVVGEQLPGGPGDAGIGRLRPPGPDRGGELGIDADLEGVRQDAGDRLAQPRPGRLAHPDPQVVLPERVRRGL